MAATKYTYSVANDTLNGTVAPAELVNEIGSSSIITALEGSPSALGDVLDIWFKDALSAGDKTTLDSVVAAHDGTMEPGDLTVVKLQEHDVETGGVMMTPRYQPQGWLQQLFEIEFETSKLNSIHEKDIDNADIGWSSLKFYKLVSDVETEWTPTDQADLDSNCVRTDFIWEPDVDYQILSGQMAQIVTPSEDFYVWGVGIDLDALYGGPQVVFAEGGINMAYVGAHTAVGLDGKGAPFLYTDKVKSGVDADGNPTYTVLGTGKGTNRMRFICRHSAGFKHRLQPIFEIFRGP